MTKNQSKDEPKVVEEPESVQQQFESVANGMHFRKYLSQLDLESAYMTLSSKMVAQKELLLTELIESVDADIESEAKKIYGSQQQSQKEKIALMVKKKEEPAEQQAVHLEFNWYAKQDDDQISEVRNPFDDFLRDQVSGLKTTT